MKPKRAVRGQLIFALLAAVFALLGGQAMPLLVILAASLAYAAVLCLYYFRSISDQVERTKDRRKGDREIGFQCLGVVAILLLAVLQVWNGKQQLAIHQLNAELTVGSLLLSLGLLVIWASSITDWFYIRPCREGFFSGLPACREDREERLSWTKYWIIHRALATVFGVVFLAMGVYLLAFGLLQPALGGDSKVPQFLATLPATGIVLLVIQGFGHWDGLRAHNVLATPRFAVGDVLRLPARNEDFILTSVSLDNLELFNTTDKRIENHSAAAVLASSDIEVRPAVNLCEGGECRAYFQGCACNPSTAREEMGG